MAQDSKKAEEPTAESVDREPADEPAPRSEGMPVGPDDEPRGLPTSDRFRTEQAHRKADAVEPKAGDPKADDPKAGNRKADK